VNRCEWAECAAWAIGEVHAQWTVVDFVSYAACEEHYEWMVEWLWKRHVDGQPPADVWVSWWDSEPSLPLESPS
jgi:hypothetical protein